MPYTVDPNEFIIEQNTRIQRYYNNNKTKLLGFGARQEFIEWYEHELYFHNNCCHYCKVSILDIRRLLNANIIRGRSVRGDGNRGANLEVDRRNSFAPYSHANCVLCCYYCNNDKSNTYDYETYRDIFGPARQKAWELLLLRLWQ